MKRKGLTREEAIQRLNLLKGSFCVDTETALDMAISALSEAENGCDGCLYEVSDGSLFPCNICRLNYGCKYEKDNSKNITESPNEAIKTDDEVIDHGKEWIIGCIKHDGFIKTDRFDKANQIILDALEKQTEPTDIISRADAMGAVQDHFNADGFKGYDDGQKMMNRIKALPSVSAERVGEWNNHEVACLLSELFGDNCACNYNDIDSWLPNYCDLVDSCPHTVGVACWEQFLKHRAKMKGGTE